MNRVLIAALLIAALPVAAAGGNEPPQHLKAILHINTAIADGGLTALQVADIARKNDISVVIYTERDLMRWTYGQWPLRNIVYRRVENNSIATYGAREYLESVDYIQGQLPRMIVMHGTESAPFYYWTGSPHEDNMEMFDWHKHFLTFGLETAEDYERLPVVENHRGLRKDFDPFLMWPVLLIIVGAAVLIRPPSHQHRPHVMNLTRVGGILIIAVATVFFVNNWPFYTQVFDTYHGPQGTFPYQNYIDYVNEKGGLTYWAHPEGENIGELSGIRFETRDHSQDMLNTHGYTGFCVFYTGYKKVGAVGGVWDALLLEYCRGLRERPVWAIAGMAFEGGHEDLKKRMDVQTVILAKQRSRQGVLDALRGGSCYAIRGKREFELDTFRVGDEAETVSGDAGETVHIPGTRVIYAEGGFEKGGGSVTIAIIRNGEILETYKVESPFRVLHSDNIIATGKTYYRLEVRGRGVWLITNPIFANLGDAHTVGDAHEIRTFEQAPAPTVLVRGGG